jgi:hypothetical protein
MTAGGRGELLVFGFESASASRFEGQLVGALERAESGGAIRVRDVLFVGRDEAGELAAVAVRGGAGGLVAALADARLDEGRRRATTERALTAHATLEELGATLEPGAALVAVVIEHVWDVALGDAVARTGGQALAREDVPAGEPPDLPRRALELRRAAPAGGGSPR